jgi:long-chain fatty acid transport protein
MRLSARIVSIEACAMALFAATSGAVFAGGFGIEQSAFYQGMSFAGAAAGGESLSSLTWNPATATFAGKDLVFESSYSVVLMQADLTVDNPGAQLVAGPNDTEMGRNGLVGASYAAYRLDNKTVLALSLSAPFGLGTKAKNQDWVGSLEGVTTTLYNLNAAPVVSYEVVHGISVAAGVQVNWFDMQRQTAGNANIRADGVAVGGVAGIEFAPSPDTAIGIGYRSALNHTLDGHVTVGAFGEAPVQASLILPEMVSLGVRHAVSSDTRLTGEVEWVNWSRLGVVPVVLQAPLLGAPAGTAAANLDFQWRDGWLFALGGEYDWSPCLTLRSGVAYEISPVGNATSRLVQDPDSNRVWLSLGASYDWDKDTRFDFSYSHVFFEDNAPFDRVGAAFPTPRLLGTADVSMDIISVGYKVVWGGAPAPVALK